MMTYYFQFQQQRVEDPTFPIPAPNPNPLSFLLSFFLSLKPVLIIILVIIIIPKFKITRAMVMVASSSVSSLQVENVVFPPAAKAPGSSNTFFLAGAGVRGLQIGDKFVKFTAIGIYLQDNAVPSLAIKWNANTSHQLNQSVQFFRDIVTGPFEKFMQVTMILPLTGQQYAEKVSENCVAIWKQLGIYTDEEAKAIEKFVSVFKDETFPPGSSILFTVSPKGYLVISFSKDGSIPDDGTAVIENKLLSEAVLESMIGKNGVSPEAKQSLATRLSELFKEGGDTGNGLNPAKDENSKNGSYPTKDVKTANGPSSTEDEKSATEDEKSATEDLAPKLS